MFALICLFGIIATLSGLWEVVLKKERKNKNSFLRGFIVGFCVVCVGWLFYYLFNPPAIEVYRGNTALRVIYEDIEFRGLVPMDSTVLWRNPKL